jgi:hypothetical protein
MVLIWKRRRRTSLVQRLVFTLYKTQIEETENETYKGYVHVWATAPEIAPASSFRHGLGFFSPSGVKYVRTDS